MYCLDKLMETVAQVNIQLTRTVFAHHIVMQCFERPIRTKTRYRIGPLLFILLKRRTD